MITITIPSTEIYDETREEFIYTKQQTLKLEHSLVSIHKWEAKWHKPFLSKEDRTYEEDIDYIRCMTITQNVNPDAYYAITNEDRSRINEYLKDPMTASRIYRDDKSPKQRRTVTSELIYYWMITLQIPVEFQTWHLNQLLALIEVCNAENEPPKKMTRREILEQNAALNAKRRAEMNSKG